jgi:hypothetical protein
VTNTLGTVWTLFWLTFFLTTPKWRKHSSQQCICVKRGWRVVQRFRIFNAFAVGDSAWLRKPRSNANTHVVRNGLRTVKAIEHRRTTK